MRISQADHVAHVTQVEEGQAESDFASHRLINAEGPVGGAAKAPWELLVGKDNM